MNESLNAIDDAINTFAIGPINEPIKASIIIDLPPTRLTISDMGKDNQYKTPTPLPAEAISRIRLILAFRRAPRGSVGRRETFRGGAYYPQPNAETLNTRNHLRWFGDAGKPKDPAGKL